MQRLTIIATALTLCALAALGLVDAVRDGRVETAVLFAGILAGVLLLAGLRSTSRSVALRRDLFGWVERTSTVTGESPSELVNRAVSRLRADVGRATTADD